MVFVDNATRQQEQRQELQQQTARARNMQNTLALAQTSCCIMLSNLQFIEAIRSHFDKCAEKGSAKPLRIYNKRCGIIFVTFIR